MALFVVSLAWKLYCLHRLLASPLYGSLTADSEAYWTWAQVLVRNGWVGKNPFFLGPLYPYLLAVLEPTATASYVAPLIVQCVLGAATVVLIGEAARSVCAPRFAFGSSVLASGYAMATFMDLSVLSESLLWFLGAGFLCLQLRAVSKGPGRAFPAVSGLLTGIMSLARPSFMFLLAPTVVSVAASRGTRGALRAFAIALA
ncbi:MAG TPA: glycosyltransferase family 39 protein, partial [Verrucomicrobiae bacterium]|nr:glycosyltransferase family 39 protein [Verrucomicrobiae bacterium]